MSSMLLPIGSCKLARTPTFVALQVDRNGLREVIAEVADVLLGKRLPCDNYVVR